MPDVRGTQIHFSKAYDFFFGRFIRRTDQRILDVAEVVQGDRVLDIGTGPGYLAIAAATRVGHTGGAVGIDLSHEMIVRAKARATDAHERLQFIETPAQNLPISSESFDVIVSRLAIHHMPGNVKELAAAEMHRVLLPGGRVVIADLASHGASVFHHLFGRILGMPKQENTDLAELLSGAGFTDVESGRIGMLGYAKGRKG